MSKSRFLYIHKGEETRIWVKDQTFQYPEDTQFFPLSQFTTDDLLKVKAQIASELENRMDLDAVTEKNLEQLKVKISSAPSEVIAQLIRQTLDRLDVVGADEKRAKTRLEILQDEMRNRLTADGVSEFKFNGLVAVSYKPETVYSVGEDGWGKVYNGIVAETLSNIVDQDDCSVLVKDEDNHGITESLDHEVNRIIDSVRQRIKTEEMVSGEDQSVRYELLEQIKDELAQIELDVSNVAESIVDNLCDYIKTRGIDNTEAFAIMQKRLTSTTLNDLTKQGFALPQGIESQEIRKVKIRRLK